MSSVPLVALQGRGDNPGLAEGAQIGLALQQGRRERALAPGQLQLQQQTIQQNQNLLRQQAEQEQEMQTVQQALAQNPGKTIGDILPQIQGKISPQTFIGLSEAHQKMAKASLDLTDGEQKTHAAANAQLQNLYDNIAPMDDQSRAQAWPQIAQQINSIPGSTFKVDPNKPLSGPELQQAGSTLGLSQAYLAMGMKEKKDLADLAKTQAETNKINAEVGGAVGPLAESKYRKVLSDLSAGKPVSDVDLQFAKGFELSSRKTTTSSDTLGVTSTNTSGPSGLAAVGRRGPTSGGTGGGAVPSAAGAGAQGAKSGLVDLVGTYKLNPTMLQRMLVKHPEIINAVAQKYPDFDQTEYNAKNKIVQSYTSGTESHSINAINTAIGHAGELGTAIDALKNGDFSILNSIANKFSIATGGTPVTTFNLIVHRLAPEIASAYIKGGGGEKDRAADASDFEPNKGDAQLRTNLATTIRLLRSKVSAQENQWNTTFKPTSAENQFETRFLTPQTREALSKYGGGGPGGVGKPAGATHTGVGSVDKKTHWLDAQGNDLGIAQ